MVIRTFALMPAPASMVVRKRRRVVACLLAAFLVSGTAFAQDTHYWNLFYGTQATLLGGAVIGSASDLSASYYNPGMLAVNREQGLLVGANVYTYQRYSVAQSDAPGVVDGRIAPAPGLVAGRIPVDSATIGGIAYSILTRQAMQSKIEARFVGSKDVLGNDGLPEQYSSDLLFNANLSDIWVGATLFRLVDPRIGIGLSNYVAVRSQKTRSSADGQALQDNGTLSSASRIVDIDYTNFRLLWKLGLGIDLDPLTLGLTVTTPSVNLFGSGSLFVSYASTVPGDTSGKPVFLASNQEDVSSRYKTSWAVGVGLGYRFGKARVHFSAEWYAAVPLFRVLETSAFTGQSNGQQYPLEITDERRSVVNAGLGLQYAVGSDVTLFGSVVTDFSYVPEGTQSNLSLTPWDLLHFSFGTVLSFSLLDLTLGLSFAQGSAPLKDVPWSTVAASLGKVIGTSGGNDIQYTSATAVLAFTFKL